LDKFLPISSSKNAVLRAIWSRLKRAVDDGQVDGSFSVVIVLPAATEEAFTQSITTESLWSKKRGLIPTLQHYLIANGHDRETWKSLLRVFCLGKTYPMEDGSWNFMTIYIHAKVLIVDGKVAVVGSANLNDRSLLGTGDSELDLRIDGDFASHLQRRLLGYHAPSGYNDDRLASSLGEIADANWGRLETAWPSMFNASHRAGLPVFSYEDVAKVTFGMFVPRAPATDSLPVLDGMLIPWQKDLWGNATWQRAVDKLPWIGPAVRSWITKMPVSRRNTTPSLFII